MVSLVIVLILWITGYQCQKLINFDVAKKDGDAIMSRISRGSAAVDGQFPFQAMVSHTISGGRDLQCSASLIDPSWLLTAAHCVIGGSLFRIHIGDVSTNVGDSLELFTNRAIIYPWFDGMHDIALLHLITPLKLTGNIKLIHLPPRNYQSTYNSQPKEAVVSGWGKTDSESTLPIIENGEASKTLQFARVNITTTQQCRLTWRITENMLCTDTSEGKGSCQGDSGGPLIIPDGVGNGQPILVGIVSFGDGKCPNIKPNVYTKVEAYLDWIYSVTGMLNKDFRSSTRYF